MKFKKILKWELFAGLTFILIINFILLNLLVNTIFKNAIDKELDSRLSIIGDSLGKAIDTSAFLLSPEDRFTPYYSRYLSALNETKKTWSLDITLINTSGKTCVTTLQGYNFFDSYFLQPGENYSITYFENGLPVKNYIYRYMDDGVIKGYIVMELRGRPLAFFGEIRNLQLSIMLGLFVFAMVIAFIFSYLITRRIEYTVKEMEIISKGDMNRRIKADWFDEFSYLQEQINKMVGNIKEIQESRYKEIQIVAMGLAHEIKNPAAAIYALSEIIQRGKVDIKTADNLVKIKGEVIRLNTIVEKFIHFARDMEPQKSSLKIGVFTGFLTEQYPDLKISLKGLRPEDMITIDEVLMERAFKNIIKNSYEAGASALELSVAKEKDVFVFNIKDDAVLIGSEVRDKIWIPFFTTKSTGMGIGLAITKNIIEKHKGSVVYMVSEGKNCFEIVLPV
jgi:signal transduction histidine kinase